jgi:uncharacterized protein with HEPN domain
MSRSFDLYLEDIIEAVRKIQSYTLHIDFQRLIASEVLLDFIRCTCRVRTVVDRSGSSGIVIWISS